jgi:hypothetical protein
LSTTKTFILLKASVLKKKKIFSVEEGKQAGQTKIVFFYYDSSENMLLI